MADKKDKAQDAQLTLTITKRGVVTALLSLLVACVFAAGCYAFWYATHEHAVMPTEFTDPVIDTADVSGGVAASVNGVEIGENCITAYIESFREMQDLEDDDDWGTWVIESGYTIDGIRSDTLDMYVSQELIRQAAEQEGITVTEAAIEARVQEAMDEAEAEDGWDAALEEMGMSEEAYFYNVEVTLLQAALMEAVAADATAEDDDVLEYIQTYEEDYEDVESLDEVDEDTVASYRSYADSLAQEEEFNTWMSDFQDASDIEEESLPDDVSYNIDLTEYEEAYYAAIEEENASEE